MEEQNNIVIKRVKKVAAGHHGGSWKIAMADFAIAMMAFFLLMWLLANTTEDQKIELEQFFSDPVGYMDKVGRLTPIDLGGSPSIIKQINTSADTEQIEQAQMLNKDDPEQLAASIESNTEVMDSLQSVLIKTVSESETLQKFKDQLSIDIRPDGLHIQIVDNKLRPMFDPGSDKIKNYFAEILLQLAPVISQVNNKISVNGHTDAAAFGDTDYYSNWELSSERANAARRMLIEGGLPQNNVAQVVGYSSSQLYKPDDPLDPINRRIEIVVMNKPVERELSPDTIPEGNGVEAGGESELDEAERLLNESPFQEIPRYNPLDTNNVIRPNRAESSYGTERLGPGGEPIEQARPRASSQPEATPEQIAPEEVLNSLNGLLSQPDSPYVPPPEVE
ncbi:flagellar motor protein MotB [Oceanospirillum sp.]|uniref:flagellar motor protein MotB n=1 Tax=Oceanospirillum sp. TaxID=2021254 RepID=UPI003A8C8EC4